jgi:hypothetical protein
MNKANQCDYCLYLVNDEEFDEVYCSMNMDQDELAKSEYGRNSSCNYFRMGDDYTIVKKQGL